MVIFTKGNPRVDRHLDTNGDGTGNKESNVDGSITPVVFKISPPATGSIVVERLIIQIQDTAGFRAERYAGLSAALTNGIQLGMFSDADDSLVTDFLDGHAITTNAGWGHYSYDVDVKSWGAGEEFLLCRWTLSRAGTQLLLTAGDTESLGIKVRDNLSGLTEHSVVAQGFVKEH